MAKRRRQPPEHRAALRRHRLIRYTASLLLGGFALAVFLDHLGCFGYRGDDRAHFDQKRFTIESITDRATLVLDDAPHTEVTLLGVRVPAPGESGASAAKAYLQHAVVDKQVILKLDPLQTRDEGRLRAYVYSNESEVLNVLVVKDGIAYADTAKHALRASVEAAEADARRHHRGVWNDIKTARP